MRWIDRVIDRVIELGSIHQKLLTTFFFSSFHHQILRSSSQDENRLLRLLLENTKRLSWQKVFCSFKPRGETVFNVLDEIVTWQRMQPPVVAGLSDGLSGFSLGVRALSFILVPNHGVQHSRLMTTGGQVRQKMLLHSSIS